MASSSTSSMTSSEIDEFLDRQMEKQAREAVNTSGSFWSGLDWCLSWFRGVFKDFINSRLSQMPVVGKWASRIGTTVSELVFTVVGTALNFFRVSLCSPDVWVKAHQAAMVAFFGSFHLGLLGQIFAYGKTMSSYILEIFKQCFERAIKAHGLEVSAEEKDEISETLDNLLDKS